MLWRYVHIIIILYRIATNILVTSDIIVNLFYYFIEEKIIIQGRLFLISISLAGIRLIGLITKLILFISNKMLYFFIKFSKQNILFVLLVITL